MLAVSGLRGSEVMRLDRGDIDSAGLLTVRATKFRNYSEGVVMPSSVTGLGALWAPGHPVSRWPLTFRVRLLTWGGRAMAYGRS